MRSVLLTAVNLLLLFRAVKAVPAPPLAAPSPSISVDAADISRTSLRWSSAPALQPRRQDIPSLQRRAGITQYDGSRLMLSTPFDLTNRAYPLFVSSVVRLEPGKHYQAVVDTLFTVESIGFRYAAVMTSVSTNSFRLFHEGPVAEFSDNADWPPRIFMTVETEEDGGEPLEGYYTVRFREQGARGAFGLFEEKGDPRAAWTR